MNNLVYYFKDLLLNTNYGDFMGFLFIILIVMGIIGFLVVYRLVNKHGTLDTEFLVERLEGNTLTFAFFFLLEAIAIIFGVVALIYSIAWILSFL